MKLSDIKEKRKYIIGATTAMALVIASCAVGSGKDRAAEIVAPNDAALAGGVDTVLYEATAGDAEEDLLTQLSDGINVNEKDVYKDETVYVFADAAGNKKTVLVNELLKNADKQNSLTDTTDLKDIVNVKGDEEFSQDGNKITWAANGNEITYQGTTDKELPVNVKLTYYLDGQEITPDELAGKSGNVKIKFEYENNQTVSEAVGGKNEEIKVPFVAVSGVVLGDNFTNISVENGKALEEGENNIVIGYGMPGLSDSLDLDNDLLGGLSIPESFEITADVTDFSMDMSLTMVMNISDIDLGEEFDTSKLDDTIDLLTSSSQALSDGSTELADGVSTLLDSVGTYTTGVSTLKGYLDQLASSSGALASGVSTINQSAQMISQGVSTLDTALNTPMTDEEKAALAAQASTTVAQSMQAGTDTYNYIYGQAVSSFTNTVTSEQTVGMIYQGLYAQLHDTLYNAQVAAIAAQYQAMGQPITAEQIIAANGTEIEAGISEKLNQLAAGIAGGIAENGSAAVGTNVVDACTQAAKTAAGQAVVMGAEGAKSSIAAQIEAVQTNGYSLVSGAQALSTGTATAAASMPTLTSGISQIVSGAGTLNSNGTLLLNGVSTLSDGASTLSEKLAQFDEEGIQALAEAYNGDIKAFADRIQAVIKASSDYETFTLKNDDSSARTKFIIKTEGISAD